MIKDLTLELKTDYKIIRKQIKYIFLIILVGIPLILYNANFIKLEKRITTLSSQKTYLKVENTKLKEYLSVLSSPDRISKIAKIKLHMKKVDLSKVKFIDYK